MVAYAFVLGAIAAFNPCGFALLPAYLGFFLNQGTLGRGPARIRRSLVVAATVGLAFTALFGVVAAVFSVGASVIVRSLSWVGLAVGIFLIVAGGVVRAGHLLSSSIPQRFATRIGKSAARSGVRGYAAFGLAYGVTSLMHTPLLSRARRHGSRRWWPQGSPRGIRAVRGGDGHGACRDHDRGRIHSPGIHPRPWGRSDTPGS